MSWRSLPRRRWRTFEKHILNSYLTQLTTFWPTAMSKTAMSKIATCLTIPSPLTMKEPQEAHPRLLAWLTTFLPTAMSKTATCLTIPSPSTMNDPREAHPEDVFQTPNWRDISPVGSETKGNRIGPMPWIKDVQTWWNQIGTRPWIKAVHKLSNCHFSKFCALLWTWSCPYEWYFYSPCSWQRHSVIQLH